VEKHCLATGEQMGVWLSHRYTRCGKKGCKCMRGEGHGPFWYVSYKEGGRLQCRYIAVEQLKRVRHAIENYRSFQERMARLNRIHQEVTGLLKTHQRQHLVRIPGWMRAKKRNAST